MNILCLTGTNPYSFERLVSSVDVVLGPKYNVSIQLGNTNYKPNFAKSFVFCSRDEMLHLIKSSDIIITQGGFGSISDALSLGKKIIAVPRLMKLNECQDNQTEIVNYYAKKQYLVSCYDVTKLEEIILDLLNDKIVLLPFVPESEIKISDIISNYIKSFN